MFKTNVYIDGFNLYFGCLKGTSHRWLDVSKLSALLLSDKNQINHIKYFTAPVSGRPDDPQQPVRQQMYYRALRTIPNLQIIFGQFKTRKTKMPLVNENFDASKTASNHVLLFRSRNTGTETGDKVNQHLYYSREEFEVDRIFSPIPKEALLPVKWVI